MGDDVWGQKYIDNLKEVNIETKFVKITKNHSTGVAQIIVSESGENQIVIVAGANKKLSLQDLEEAKDCITNADVVVVQLETPVDVSIKAIQLCTGVKSTGYISNKFKFNVISDIHIKWCSSVI